LFRQDEPVDHHLAEADLLEVVIQDYYLVQELRVVGAAPT
jgi:hypothetical protein